MKTENTLEFSPHHFDDKEGEASKMLNNS